MATRSLVFWAVVISLLFGSLANLMLCVGRFESLDYFAAGLALLAMFTWALS
jgi:hypothetical protein